MQMKIELFKNAANRLEPVPYDSAAFDSMAKAREVAFADGKRRGVDEVAIVSIGSPLVRERWVRDGAQWKRYKPPVRRWLGGDPPIEYGVVRDPVRDRFRPPDY
jgi:hypothetical protein